MKADVLPNLKWWRQRKMMRWLIAYDIADTARLQRAYRILCNHALPLQNSVFGFGSGGAEFCAGVR
ncbi:hypothetical protein [Neisseria sp. WF04]|uniref:CRISPR-associated endonuclease Cas2 n=1 Tax=unclassified Neisseria TaxID=2623750 RepID=UPI0034CF1481